jgi:hypothetical protein
LPRPIGAEPVAPASFVGRHDHVADTKTNQFI